MPRSINIILLGILAQCLFSGEDKPLRPTIVLDGHPPEKAVVDKPAKARTDLPKFIPPSEHLVFSAEPKDEEIEACRLLSEPMIQGMGAKDSDENLNIAKIMSDVSTKKYVGREDIQAIRKHLDKHPKGRWSPSLYFHLALDEKRSGMTWSASQHFKAVWDATKDAKDGRLAELANASLAELLSIYSWAGNMEEADKLLPIASTRSMQGKALRMLEQAQYWRETMLSEPGGGYLCGPYAVKNIMAFQRKDLDPSRIDQAMRSVLAGVNNDYAPGKKSKNNSGSLLEVSKVASGLCIDLQIAKRMGDAPIPVPAIVHWKLNHYSSILKEKNGKYLVKDYGLQLDGNNELWVDDKALADSASGYFLLLTQKLPDGWEQVSGEEAIKVYGRGPTSGVDNDADTVWDVITGGNATDCKGMPSWSVHLLKISLSINDTPLGYDPPRGPAIAFSVSYGQKASAGAYISTRTNFGSQWSSDMLQYMDGLHSNYITPPGYFKPVWHDGFYDQSGNWHPGYTENVWVQPPDELVSIDLQRHYAPFGMYKTNLSADLKVVIDGNTYFSNTTYDARSGEKVYLRCDLQTAMIVQSGGGKFIFTRSLNNGYYNLTSVIDENNNTMEIGWDANNRITYVKDAVNQVSTFEYNCVGDIYKPTKIIDPFGRQAIFTYNSSRLESITDAVGMTSSFTYENTSSDVITAIITPYGTTNFTRGNTPAVQQVWLEATDPLGDVERFEYFGTNVGLMSGNGKDPDSAVPVVENVAFFNDYLNFRNVFYWSKKAMKMYPKDYTKAEIYHFLHSTDTSKTGRLLESIKKPFESRVWFRYGGQTWEAGEAGITVDKPIITARRLDNGTTECNRFSYLADGKPLTVTDPLGRLTTLVYSSDEQDLKEVRQNIAGSTAPSMLLGTFNYDTKHNVTESIDASGRSTKYEYNSFGQLTKITPPQRSGFALEPVTVTYKTNGHVDQVFDTVGAVATYTYDPAGRVSTITNRDGYVITIEYDGLDRVTKVTHPDGTYEQCSWNRLDPEWVRDRAGRWTRSLYNAVRQVTAVKDANNDYTSFTWCKCGAMKSLCDAKGNLTAWEYDVKGRLISKTYGDGQMINYIYEAMSGRLKSITDAKGQVASMRYLLDGSLAGVDYTNCTVATPSISFVYDNIIPRLLSMTDGIGTTNYSYNAIGTSIPVTPVLGAGMLSSIDGPWTNDTITVGYDEWGRQTSGTVAGQSSSLVIDTVGRITSATNLLGSYQYAYIGNTGRIDQITHPNGMISKLSYFGVNQDLRISNILHKKSGGQRISEFGYTYKSDGQIDTWSQTVDNGVASVWSMTYDNINQLTNVLINSGSVGGALIKASKFMYDKSGNRISSSVQTSSGLSVSKMAFNNVNQVVSTGPGGKIKIIGAVDESATVRVNGEAVQVNADKTFSADVDASSSQNQFAVEAKDLSGNIRNTTWRIDTTNSVASTTPTYDFNGNCTSDGLRTYEWDGLNRMTAINYGSKRSEFLYDGFGRRVKIVEKTNGSITADRRFLWVGASIAEERASDCTTVVKRYFGGGFQVVSGTNAGKYFYTRDHLGSVREVLDAAGNIRARFDYDAWGNQVQVSGTLTDVDFGYTGHFNHKTSGLWLTWFRAYDPSMGRWLSRDPIGERGGLNLYGYCGNNPAINIDPFGLEITVTTDSGCETFGNTRDFMTWLENQRAANRSGFIKSIMIYGHGYPIGGMKDVYYINVMVPKTASMGSNTGFMFSMHSTNSSSAGLLANIQVGSLEVNGEDKLVGYGADMFHRENFILDDLKKMMAKKSSIQLRACHSGGSSNESWRPARALSRALINNETTVSGHMGKWYYNATQSFFTGKPDDGLWTSYLGGSAVSTGAPWK